MAQGNMLLGYARGSVGDVVFSRSKGKQTSRARNRNPFNPRTDSQMIQRSKFTNASNFFTRGTQALFKFAYEDQKQGESDFNAFMRHNVKNSFLVAKDASETSTYPAFGRWQLSEGSLREIKIQFHEPDEQDEGIYFYFDVPGMGQSTTWGGFSEKLIEKYNAENGDLLTVLKIKQEGITTEQYPRRGDFFDVPITWDIHQFALDLDSDDTISIHTNGLFDNAEGRVEIDAEDTVSFEAAAMIISRPNSKKLKVSTSFLCCTRGFEDIYTALKDPYWRDYVLETWQATGKAILKGGAK